MIITKLIGGLGNQMFQYAIGRQAAITNNTELKLDITGYDHQTDIIPRMYMLNIFDIHASIATEQEIKLFNNHSRYRIERNIHRIILILLRRHYIRQKTTGFTHEFMTIPDSSYLDGFWANEKYFKDIENIIRKEFTFKYKPNVVNRKIINSIKSCNSASVHIRRGDYAFDERTNKNHGTCDLEYYLKAITLLAEKVKDPHFFIFSDDIKWAKQNLYLKFPCTYVDHNTGKKDYEDMRLMSLCKYNIIANSSFSWWGAWLNQNPNKIVIAPKKWFKNRSINTKDLIPRPWIKI